MDKLIFNFINKNLKNIKKNPRMGMIKMSFDRISDEKLLIHKKIAKKFINEKTKI